MTPGKPTRKQSYDAVTGEGDDIVIRIMEALTDERILNILKKGLYPQPLCNKIDEMNAKMANLTEQVTQRDFKINELEKRIFILEDNCDRAKQYTRRSSLVFRGLAEQGQGENTEAIVTSFVNDHIYASDVATLVPRHSALSSSRHPTIRHATPPDHRAVRV